MTNFEQFERSSAGRRAKTLLANSQLERIRMLTLEKLYATVLEEVSAALPGLIECGRFTTAMLCGPIRWAGWKGNAGGFSAGICMSHMQRAKVVTLVVYKTKSGRGARQYMLPSENLTVKYVIVQQ